MKKLILIFSLFLTCQFMTGQMTDNVDPWYTDNDTFGNRNLVCKERGHIQGGMITSTLMYCPPYYEENDTQTVLVYPACNYISYTCQRCGANISEREKEERIIIWEKGKDLTRPELKKQTVLSLDTLNVYLTDIDTPEETLGIQIDTLNHLASRIFVKSDTTAILMLVTDCDNCPAHAEKGYLVDYPVRIYLDEYKNPLKSNVNIWEWKFREEKIINTGQILKAN